ncbi:MAG: EFR1 family ferrodoxin [Lachnospiraceae bacterium]|nr:EFR1 family ferrodoxin [Lachnospiraceae bacterium]
MIFYFSATGNSKYVAQKIALATGEITVSIADCVKTGCYHFSLEQKEMLGFVTPVYLMSLPAVVVDFVRKLELEAAGDHYVWHTVTYGRMPGPVSSQLAELLAEKKIILQAAFRVQILSSFTPIFSVCDKKKVAKKIAASEPEINKVIDQIGKKTLDEKASVISSKTEKRIQRFQSYYDKIRKTGPFHVKDNCIGCGKCAELCPVNAIELEESKPVWTKDKCVLCLGCLHNCPQFAIQYGNRTEKHGQYLHPSIG